MERSPLMHFFVQTLKGKKISIEAETTNRIVDIKAKIEEIEGVPIDQQLLIFGGQKLGDEKTLQYYKIQQEYTIQLFINPRNNQTEKNNSMQIKVRHFTIPKGEIALNVEPTDKIEDIKLQIYDECNIPSYQQRLYFNGINLENSKTLQDYSIKSDSILNLKNNFMEIVIKKSNGKCILFKVDPTDEILYVKTLIEDKEKIPTDQQMLLFCGKLLEDKLLLQDYSIAKLSTLYLVKKLQQ